MKYKSIVAGVSIESEDRNAFLHAVVTLAHNYLKLARPALHVEAEDFRTMRKAKKHKRHMHKKVCPSCNKECNGLLGLGVHMAKNHGYVSPQSKRIAKIEVPF
jgi:hypothetical protein